MPPILALCLCSVFVLCLLRLERKQAPQVSFVVWIPTIWLLVNSSKPLGIWFGIGGVDMMSGSYLDRLFNSALFVIALPILFKRQFKWSTYFKENIWVMLLLGYMFISIFWSDIFYTSFKRWVREIVAFIMAFLIYTEHNPRNALESLFRRSIYILIPFSLLVIKYYPHLGVRYNWSGNISWTGVALQKNGLAMLCLFAIFFLSWSFIRRLKGEDVPIIKYQSSVEIFLVVLAIWLFTGPQHTLAYSATSTVALAIGLISLLGLLRMKQQQIFINPGILTLIMAIIILYGTVTPYVGKLGILDISSFFGRDETLKGRTDIWNILVPYALQAPILGHGFGGFWTDEMRSITSSHAHNGYLDTVLNLGFVGLIIFSMFLISCLRKALKILPHDFYWGVFWVCYMLMAVTHNIAESSLDGFTNNMSAIILFLSFSATSMGSRSMGILQENITSPSRHYDKGYH